MGYNRALRPLQPKTSPEAGRVMWFATPDSRTDDAFPGLANEAAAYAAMRVSGVRFDMRSGNIWNGSAYVHTTNDTRIAAFRAAGIRVMGILSPRSYSDLTTSGGRSTFANDCAEIVSHNRGLVDIWEITNEPNLASQSVAPDDYTATCNAVCPAIRAANPAATILLGGLAGAIQTTGGGHYASAAYVQNIYDDVPVALFDGISTHPYCEGLTWLGHTGDAWHAQAITYAILSIIDTMAPNHQLWITEFGSNDLDDTQAATSILYSQLIGDLIARRNVANCLCAYTYNNFDTEDAEQLLYGVVTKAGAKKSQVLPLMEYGALYDALNPTWPVVAGTGGTYQAWRNFRPAPGDWRRLRMAFCPVNDWPSGVTISRDGVITAASGVTAQTAELQVRGTSLVDGRSSTIRINLIVRNAPVINGDFIAAGNVTGWATTGANATVTWDSVTGALSCNITGAGGGWQLSTPATVVAGTTYRRRIYCKRGTYGGTAMNFFMDNLAMTPASATVPADWGWIEFTYVAGDTAANVSAARNGSFTGTILVLKDITEPV